MLLVPVQDRLENNINPMDLHKGNHHFHTRPCPTLMWRLALLRARHVTRKMPRS